MCHFLGEVGGLHKQSYVMQVEIHKSKTIQLEYVPPELV